MFVACIYRFEHWGKMRGGRIDLAYVPFGGCTCLFKHRRCVVSRGPMNGIQLLGIPWLLVWNQGAERSCFADFVLVAVCDVGRLCSHGGIASPAGCWWGVAFSVHVGLPIENPRCTVSCEGWYTFSRSDGCMRYKD